MALLDFMKRREKVEKQKRIRETPASLEAPVETRETLVAPQEHHEGLALVAPHITEKSRDMSHHNGYVFEVVDEATKANVKESVERMYKVHVSDVRMINMPGKPRRRGLTKGLKKGYKKAIVQLKSGESIDLF